MHPQSNTIPTRQRDRAAYHAAYRQRNKERLAAKGRAWRLYRPGYAAAYYQEHREQIIARAAAWHLDHPERAALRGRAYYEEHKEEVAAQARAYRQQHPEEVAARDIARRQREREGVIAAYGGQCVLCDEREPAFLTLDHVNGGGKKDQRESGNVYQIYRRLKREGWPPTHQVLCANCNHAKEMAKRRGSSESAICYRRLRAQALEAYGGGKCTCCGEANPLSLEIDHINGGGGKDRRESGGNGAIYRRLRREGWPPGYQILCANCNYAKAFSPGGCPHLARP